MKARMLIEAIVVAVLAVAAGYAQAQSGSEVDVQEKLGETVALDVPLTDENGNEIALRSLVDKPTILIFNYFRCPGICPILFSSMVNAVNRMDLEPGEDYRLVAVSFDPADTPEMARQKKANYLNMMRRPFPPDAWRFLTGSAADTRAVADSAGFRFRRQSEDMFMHPGVIMVLTPDGILSRYIYGTSYLPAEVMMAIQEARAGQVRPTISKVLSFCYSYDPEGRRYVFRVTRFFGALILALAVLFTVFILFRKKTKQAQP
ncbi:MAG: SCO family protein [Acidobacteria bacterium]|nr:SCO family protein [Acidobacteriota bacterium]